VLIDDMEGTGNGPIKLKVTDTLPGSLPGYWFDGVSLTQADGGIGAPNTLTPRPFTFTMLPMPHTTYSGTMSTSGAHVACSIGDQYGFCQEAFEFAQIPASDAGAASDAADAAPIPRITQQFDISQYKQVTFWTMAGASAGTQSLKVLFPDVNSDPRGGICGVGDAGQCYDSWSYPVPGTMLTTSWSQVTINLGTDLVAQNFGHEAAAYDPHHAYGIGFQVGGPNTADSGMIVRADYWIDDIYFVK
jgi:hypothetical protein